MNSKRQIVTHILPAESAEVLPASLTPLESDAVHTARQLRVLKELAEMGMSIVRLLGEQAVTDPNPAAAKSFIRAADEVRRTIALEARIAEDYRKRTEARPLPQPAPRPAPAIGGTPAGRQEQIRRYLERLRRAVTAAIVADSEPAQVAPRIARLESFLGSPRLRTELLRSSLTEIAASMCRALGVAVDPELFAQLTARSTTALPRTPEPAAAPGPAPFSDGPPTVPPRTRTVHKPS